MYVYTVHVHTPRYSPHSSYHELRVCKLGNTISYGKYCIFLLLTSKLFSLHSSYSWFWGDIPRSEAEKWLLTNNNKSGTFLVRMSSSQKDSLSLSVRDGESVKHYRIRRFDDGSYYVATRITFNSIPVSSVLCLGCGVSE